MDKDIIDRVVDIVKKMSGDNVSIKDIEDDLRNTGFAPYEVKRILKEANVGPTPSEVHEVLSSLHTKIDSGEHVKSTLKAIEKNERKIDNIEVKVQELQGDVEEIKGTLEEIKRILKKE